MKFFLNILTLLLLVGAHLSAQPREKLAQTGLQFLSVVSDARAAALGGSMTSMDLQSTSLFFNPAGMAKMDGFIDVAFSKNSWIADISYNTLSLAVSPFSRRYGVLGFTMQSVDYGEILATEVAPGTEKGYIDIEPIKPSAFALGVGYAKDLTDKFSVGGQVKYVRWSLGESQIWLPRDSSRATVKNEVTPVAFDFGTIFKTGIRSLTFGMSVRNFSQEIKFSEESFQLPLVFSFGISVDVFEFAGYAREDHSLVLSVDATHPRSHPEQILLGLDYNFMNTFFLRGGYVSNRDEENVSFGIGVSKLGFTVDYAYTPYGLFDNVQRFSVRFHL